MNSKTNIPGIIEIHGQDYQTVAYRLNLMRQEHPTWAVRTKIVDMSSTQVIVRAQVLDDQGRIMGSGHAHELHTDRGINQTSYVENCETSAIGRALASAGYLGTDVATAEEIDVARADRAIQFFTEYLDLVRMYWSTLADFKEQMAEGTVDPRNLRASLSVAIPEEHLKRLWRAPSNGSIFETWERDKTGSSKRPDAPDPDDAPSHPKMES